jgi:hypothetical protein
MDQKKPSIEEILAMARQQKAGGGGQSPAKGKPGDEVGSQEPSAQEAAPPEGAAEPQSPAKPKPAPGGKPSVTDILAMARGESRPLRRPPLRPQRSRLPRSQRLPQNRPSPPRKRPSRWKPPR